jgi:hypothetical protein
LVSRLPKTRMYINMVMQKQPGHPNKAFCARTCQTDRRWKCRFFSFWRVTVFFMVVACCCFRLSHYEGLVTNVGGFRHVRQRQHQRATKPKGDKASKTPARWIETEV